MRGNELSRVELRDPHVIRIEEIAEEKGGGAQELAPQGALVHDLEVEGLVQPDVVKHEDLIPDGRLGILFELGGLLLLLLIQVQLATRIGGRA